MIRERILVFILVISALMYLANISQALTFDFENADQEDEWTDLAGTLEIRDGMMCSVSAADGPLVSFIADWEDDWSDYNIKVKAQGLVADADWGIAFRVQDIQNHYSWQFCNGNLMFISYVANARTEAFTVVQAEVLNEWQDYRVDVKGNKFDLYFGGELIQSVTDDALETGSVGTFVWINGGTTLGDHGGVAFDNLNIDGEGIPGSLTAVTPEARLSTTWGELKSEY